MRVAVGLLEAPKNRLPNAFERDPREGLLHPRGRLVDVVPLDACQAVLPALSPTLALSVRGGDVAQAATIAGAVALAAALVPLARVLRVAPAAVFRRGS